jgi:hypothetical protein
MSYRLEPWIEQRIKGEQLTPLTTLIAGYMDKGIAYKDAVDTPYTFRYYGREKSTDDILQSDNFAEKFYEIQSTAFERLWDTHTRKDKELLPVALSSVLLLSADENVRKILRKMFDFMNK